MSARVHTHEWREIARTTSGILRILFGCAVAGCIDTKVETR